MLSFNSSFAVFWQSESKCKKLQWVKEDGRTQGGGWIWFSGTATDEDLELAYIKAEGMAISRLIQECIFPHKEVKFHERCDEKIGEYFRVYVRASLTGRQCNESKYATKKFRAKIYNSKLIETYNKYKKISGEKEVVISGCNLNSPKKCYDLGKYEFQMGQYQKAFNSFNIACKATLSGACFNAGLSLMMLHNNSEKSKGFFELSCSNNDPKGCLFAGIIYKNQGNGRLTKQYLKKSCDLQDSVGCLTLADYFKEKKIILMAKQFYEKGCNLKSPESCHELSYLLAKQGDDISSMQAAKGACILGFSKACYNVGFMAQKITNCQEKPMVFFKKACDLGLSVGCIKVYEKNKSITYLKKSCDLGDKLGCKKVSEVLYDKKKFNESIKFAIHACKLGELKSCYNVGYLKSKNGDKESAKVFFKYSCDKGFKPSCKK